MSHVAPPRGRFPARGVRGPTPANSVPRLVINAMRLLGVAVLGCILSLALYQAWQLEPRWSAVVFIAITAVAISMCLARFFSDFLLIAILFCLPVASFVKFIWPSGYSVTDNVAVAYSGLNNIGVVDFIIVGLYLSWFYRLFVIRQESMNWQFNQLDFFVLWFLFANIVATIGSIDPRLGVGATTYFLKYALLYFYLSRHFEERHLPWLLAAFAFTIAVETLLGAYQFATGKLVGLAIDKGLGNSETLNNFITVPGQGNYHRAAGTLTEPHALAQLLGMLLPFCGVLFLTPQLRPVLRVLSLIATGGAAMTIVFTLARGPYIGVGVSLALGVVLMLALWGERQVLVGLVVLVLLSALVAPLAAPVLYDRLTNSLVTFSARIPVYWAALQVFADHALFGIGPGNWVWVYPSYDQDWLLLDWYSNLIHNDVLLISVELGIFGLIPYIGMLLAASWPLFNLARRRRDLAGRLAFAAFIGIVSAEITNQVDPGFHEMSVHLLFWVLVSLSVALPRLRAGAGVALTVQAKHPLQAPGMAAGRAAG
jgi:O-Antigen ligase